VKVEILDGIHHRLRESTELQRIVLLGAETGARYVSAVLVRVPAGHEFPLHTHPRSEDCFFVLSGSGQAVEPGRSLPVSAPAAVWIPAGHPHGLVAGSAGMLEVGFQAPADPTAIPYDAGEKAPSRQGLLAQALPAGPVSTAARDPWVGVFPVGAERRYLDPYCAMLQASESVVAEARECELVILVAAGTIELAPPSRRRLDAVAALRLDPGGALELRAVDAPALLLGIRARAAA
jgi:mannose-6-phosphate isomerase-like protein (cupin superfamily)